MTRLKQHKSGSRLTLRETDLLHALIMPASLNVHTVRLIVSKTGELELAEWITGEDGKYSHKKEILRQTEVAALAESLSSLQQAEHAINFSGIEFDYDQYEGKERKLLRFWVDHEIHELSLLISDFYNDYDVSEEAKDNYEQAFESVIARLPLEWMT